MRKALYHLLTTDPTLVGFLPADRWFERGSVKDSQATPFAVIAWQGESRVSGMRKLPRVTIWFYQTRGSYSLIDKLVRRTCEVMDEVQQYTHAGERIAHAGYEGTSVDLYDEVYRANARNVGYHVVGSGL